MFPKNSKTFEQVDECALNSCQQPIYPGEKVWKFGCDVYCTMQHLAEGIGAKKVSVEDN
jgi:hypothetical protein